ncbi:MAG: hypothetical protein D6798_11030 [Deltaproteobacteria bacterium]|nr:MAG: hypothetical protein D6798_11030 [Deltaproteobacteria bacterium]
MSILLEPTEDAPSRVAWTMADGELVATSCPSGWRLDRSWGADPLFTTHRPRLRLGIGTGIVIASLDAPTVIAPRTSGVEWWLSWPLAVEVIAPGGEIIEQWRPGLRRTLFGAIHDGGVESTVRCTHLPDPDATAMSPPAALHVVVDSRAAGPITLRRFPVDEALLSLARADRRFVCGSVRVRVEDGQRAEVETRPLPAIGGFAPVPRDRPASSPDRVPTLSWLLDATRRSVEFQP